MADNLTKRGWKTVQLKDVSQVIGGGTPSRKKPEYWHGSIPWLTTSDLSGYPYKKIKGGRENITKLGLNNSSAKLLPKDSIIYSSRASIGYIAIADNPIATSQGFRSFVPIENKVKPDYLYYALQYYTPLIEKIASGATYKEISGGELKRIKIDIPPLTEQNKISSILTSLDKQIENNLKRIKTLEEISKLVYNEWFIHFRYPGHEDDEIVETEEGPKPKGWKWKKLGNIAKIIMGQSPRSEYYNKNGEGLPFHQGVGTFGNFFPATSRYSTKGTKIAKKGDVLFSVRAPVGRINFANMKMIIGRGLCAVRDKSGNQYFLYEQLIHKFPEEDLIGGGTVFQAVTKHDMHNLDMLIPSEPILKKYEHIASKIFSQIHILVRKNRVLTEIRDLLLPQLISGNIDVSNLDIEV
ncbi:MAG: restriction endonuclease subunit S [Petrotogales bacterium]